MSKKVPIWSKRMLLLMDQLIAKGEVENRKEFMISVGQVLNALPAIRSGKQSFTVAQIVTACKKYKVNPAWILGLSEEVKVSKGRSALDQLDDAVLAVRAEL